MLKIINLIPPTTEALIFDLDGTIADTMPLHVRAWQDAGAAYGVNITHEMIHTYAGSPTSEVIKTLNRVYNWDVPPVEAAQLKSGLFAKYLDELISLDPIPEVLEIANYYYGKLPLGIGTGSGHANATKTLQALGVEDLFDAIVTASDVVNHKPHPETFTKCADLMGVDYTNCVVFEDGPMGMIAALRGGMQVITVPTYLFMKSEEEIYSQYGKHV